MSEIAQAFVRIRPDTRGFSTEAESGVRSAFSRLATVAAGAFAIKETFDFGKALVTHAADIQKQIEVVKAEFGSAADEVLRFNEGAAAGLGISAHLADTTSARFGILFKNLGINTDQAAKMTVGFEQLAGSLSAIRGVDPSTTLKNIPLAVAGNLRSLKQLGIATDQTQLKLAAFKLGITSSITQALTPAQRAMAIFSVATANLPTFLQQASAHSGDLANRMRVLSAEWDNAKDRLGAGLLPAITSLATAFSKILPGAISGVHRVFRDLRDDVEGLVSFVKPALAPLGNLFAGVGGAFKTDGIKGAIDEIISNFQRLGPAAKLVAGYVAIIGAAFAAAFISAAPITSTILIITGLGIAFREAMNHSAAFRGEVSKIGDVLHGTIIPAVERVGHAVKPVFDEIAADARKAASAIKTGLGQALDFLGKHRQAVEVIAGAIAGATAGFIAFRIAVAAYAVVARVATAVQIAFDAAMDANPVALIVIAIGALVGALIVLYTRSATVRRILNGVFDGVAAAAHAVLPVVRSLFNGLVAGARIVVSFVTDKLIPTLSAIGHGLAPVFSGIADVIRTAFDGARTIISGFVSSVTTVVSGAAAVLRPIVGVILLPFRTAVDTALGLWHIFGRTIVAVAKNSFGGLVGFVSGVLRALKGVIEIFTGLFTGDWRKAWHGLKDVVGGAFDSIKALVKTEAGNVEAIFSGMWKAIELIFLEGVKELVDLLAKIPSVHIHIPGFGTIGFTNPFKGMDEALGHAIDRLKGTAGRAATEVPTAVAEAAAKSNAAIAKTLHTSANQAIADAARSTADVIGRGADSAEAAKAAQTAATATAAAVKSLTDTLTRSVATQDAGIQKARTKIKALGQQIADALTQEAQDVRDAVTQAESNLNSISTSLASTIGALLDKPIQDAQNRISASSNKQALENLRQSVLLPGGKQLSTDPTKALAQLQALARGAGSINRAAIQEFITQYQQAVLAVKQDQVNVTKQTTTQRISDLTDAFNRGQISLVDYKKRILAILTADHVSYRRAGSLLGSAFANGFRDQVQGLFAQAAAIAATPASARRGITGSDIQIVKPLDTIQKDNKAIAKLTHQKMDAQTALQKRIAVAAEKTAKLQAQIAAVKVNPDIGQKVGGGAGKQSQTFGKTTG